MKQRSMCRRGSAAILAASMFGWTPMAEAAAPRTTAPASTAATAETRSIPPAEAEICRKFGKRYTYWSARRTVSYRPGRMCIGYVGYRLVWQADGNLVLYRGSTVDWASHTIGRGATRLDFQWDGNVVIYSGRTPLWSTGTSSRTRPATTTFLASVGTVRGKAVAYVRMNPRKTGKYPIPLTGRHLWGSDIGRG